MRIPFYKYQGTGNDFILLDQRERQYLTTADQAQIERLCHRRFGIGADGLLLLEQAEGYDFRMVYFNADGRESTFCGNGGRCIVALANALGLIDREAHFSATDGPHRAIVQADGLIALAMQEVQEVRQKSDHVILNTGSPHYVQFVENLSEIDVVEEGRRIRHSPPFAEAGINVNFVQPNEGYLEIATYERGVEAETLSCGTGVTAAALAYALAHPTAHEEIIVETKGGTLAVRFSQAPNGTFRRVELIGPAELVFRGELSLSLPLH